MDAGGESGGQDVTALLSRWQAGDRSAGEEAMRLVYPRLRELARRRLAGQNISLQVTELVHETYLKLQSSAQPDWTSRGHFFGINGYLMRQLVVEQARHRLRKKRGGRVRAESLETVDAEHALPPRPDEWIALDAALDELEEARPELARLVELHVFAGFTLHEVAESLGVSVATAKRRFRFCKAWLRRQLQGGLDTLVKMAD